MIANNDDNSGNVGNGGNRGKFSDRIKKIRRDLFGRKKKKSSDHEKKSTLEISETNVFKIILSFPLIVYNNIVNKEADLNKVSSDKKSRDIFNTGKLNSNCNFNMNNILSSKLDKNYKIRKTESINVSLAKNKLNVSQKRDEFNDNNFINETDDIISLKLKKIRLQKEIINLIKKKLLKGINEFEILQSEFYVLNELENEDIYFNECQLRIREIKKLLSKVKSLKEKYDLLKENIDFEYIFEYDDDFLVNKILELKRLCSRGDLDNTVSDYKILDEYQFLYLKIDKLQENAFKLEEEKKRKIEDLKQRDIDFEKIKENIYDVDRENERYANFVKEQELLLKELEENVSYIDSYEKTTYRLRGFGHLLGNSFKYLGLLLVSPLKGLVPGIATQTLITKNIIHNLYDNLNWEGNRKIVYDAIDYSTSINLAINDLDVTSSLIDSTLEDIIKLKSKYKEQFSMYEGFFSEYNDAIKKMNKIENAILGSKIKINRMKQEMMENEKKNSSKLIMVKKLNDSK